MANQKFTNYARTTLLVGITAVDVSITVAAGAGALFPALAAGEYYYATLLIVASNTKEIVKVTARTTDVMTIVRAQDNTTAIVFSAGDRVELRIVAATLTNFIATDFVNTFTATQNYAAGASVASAATVNLTALLDGNTRTLTGTTNISAWTIANGAIHDLIYTGAGLTLTHNAVTNNLNAAGGNDSLATGDRLKIFATAGVVYCNVTTAAGTSVVSPSVVTIPVRQTVLSGAVDTNGFSSFGGAIGSTTVTAAATLIATAANSFTIAKGALDFTGSIVNPSWTGLSTNGIMFLYLDIASNGTCTTGSTTLAPIYQFGGAYSITSAQFTFNTQEMIGKVGNGATAAQTYRIFVGEVTVAGAVVTAIAWYALMGRYQSIDTTVPALGTRTTFAANLGLINATAIAYLRNIVAEIGYTIGDIVPAVSISNAGAASMASGSTSGRNTAVIQAGNGTGTPFQILNQTTGGINTITSANWKMFITAQRNF